MILYPRYKRPRVAFLKSCTSASSTRQPRSLGSDKCSVLLLCHPLRAVLLLRGPKKKNVGMIRACRILLATHLFVHVSTVSAEISSGMVQRLDLFLLHVGTARSILRRGTKRHLVVVVRGSVVEKAERVRCRPPNATSQQ